MGEVREGRASPSPSTQPFLGRKLECAQACRDRVASAPMQGGAQVRYLGVVQARLLVTRRQPRDGVVPGVRGLRASGRLVGSGVRGGPFGLELVGAAGAVGEPGGEVVAARLAAGVAVQVEAGPLRARRGVGAVRAFRGARPGRRAGSGAASPGCGRAASAAPGGCELGCDFADRGRDIRRGGRRCRSRRGGMGPGPSASSRRRWRRAGPG